MAEKKIPQRQCCGCREKRDKNEMFRIIRTPDGQVCIDATGRKNGRGAYICPRMDCLRAAIKNKGIERSLNVLIPTEVLDLLTEEMKRLGK